MKPPIHYDINRAKIMQEHLKNLEKRRKEAFNTADYFIHQDFVPALCIIDGVVFTTIKKEIDIFKNNTNKVIYTVRIYADRMVMPKEALDQLNDLLIKFINDLKASETIKINLYYEEFDKFKTDILPNIGMIHISSFNELSKEKLESILKTDGAFISDYGPNFKLIHY